MTPRAIRRFVGVLPLCALAALLVGCAAAGSDMGFPGPDRAAADLDEDEVWAITAILALEDRREFDAPALERLAASGSIEVRRRAVVAAGRIGNPAAVPLLLGVLARDPAAAVRADAAFALGLLRDSSDAVVEGLRAAAPPSWVPVRPEEVPVVVEVLAALGRIGSRPAAALVSSALRDASPATSEAARAIAAEALLTAWRFGEATPVASIARFLHAGDPGIRWRAAYALMRSGRPDAVPFLLGGTADDEHRVRAYAARAFAAHRADSAQVRDSALHLLSGFLRDDHAHVRINALGAIASYGTDAPLDDVVARLRDVDPNVAIAAAGAAARLGSRAAVPLAGAAEDVSLPIGVRGAALAGLASVDQDRAWSIAEAWTTGDFRSRWLAARALAAFDWPRARDAVRILAADADVRVAIAALESAGAIVSRAAAAGEGIPPADSAALHPLLERLPRLGQPAAELASPADRAAADPGYYRDIARRYVAAPLSGGARPRALLRTAGGEIEIELLAEEAPLTVANFVALAEAGYFDGGLWHRVVPNFVLQDGAPGGYANGGPGWAIRDEINRVRYGRGIMGMALSGPDTGGSQWFITHSPQPHLDGGYTVFGRVTDGMDVADRVVQGDPILSIRVLW